MGWSGYLWEFFTHIPPYSSPLIYLLVEMRIDLNKQNGVIDCHPQLVGQAYTHCHQPQPSMSLNFHIAFHCMESSRMMNFQVLRLLVCKMSQNMASRQENGNDLVTTCLPYFQGTDLVPSNSLYQNQWRMQWLKSSMNKMTYSHYIQYNIRIYIQRLVFY